MSCMATSGRPVSFMDSGAPPLGPCIEWGGGRFRSGYGDAWHDGRHWRAHRLTWELANGPIPDGLHVLHLCDNPPCVNIDHLRLGTPADNAADKVLRRRHHAYSQTQCKHGHEFTPESTYVAPDGRRSCRICRQSANKKSEARRARKR